MGRFTSLTEKTYKILTKNEAYEEFEDLRESIADMPLDFFYLKITDHRPTPVKIPPQLIGPYPNKQSAKDAIREATDQHRSVLSHTEDNVIEFEQALKMREEEGA